MKTTAILAVVATVAANRCDKTCVGLHFTATAAHPNAYRPVCGNEGCATSGAVFVGLDSFGCSTDSNGWAGQECCNVRSCDRTSPAYNEDAGHDRSLNKNPNADSFCAEGYILVNSTHMMADGASWDSGDGLADDNNNSTLDAFYETCEKCPTDQSSAGGTSRSCHTINTDWEDCSHMGCTLQEVTTKHCNKHGSSNPKTDLAEGTAITETECHNFTTTSVQRIKVFHHGHEQAGTSHKCSLTGTRASATRDCKCQCMSTSVAAQTTQQAALAAQTILHQARHDAQVARGEGSVYDGAGKFASDADHAGHD